VAKLTQKGNLANQAYEILKKKIIKREIKPGEYLNEKTLLEETGVGLTPLRQAILLLKNEDLVESQPHRSAYVKDFSLEEVKELIEALVILEKKITELSILRITAPELKRLKELLTLIDQANQRAVDERDAAVVEKTSWEITELNLDFHQLIAKSARNRFLYRAYKQIRMQIQRFTYVMVRQEFFSEESPQQHYLKSSVHHHEIIRCLEKRDPQELNKIIVEHVKHFQALIFRSLMDISYD
jgi:GntR family transcriptional regulator, rspAB operon transcriptional repressor